jgi:hypothetical protein
VACDGTTSLKLLITNFRHVLLLAALFLALGPATPSLAACFNPAGNAGDHVYNGGYSTLEFCNGGSWVSMGKVGNTTTDLVGWWKFDETSGTSASDSSGNGNTGTLVDGPTWTTGGMNNGALTFVAATSQYVSVPYSSIFDFGTGSFTVSAWMKANSLPATQHAAAAQLVGKQAPNESKGWGLQFQDSSGTGKAGLYINDAAGHYATYINSTPLSLGVWYHLVFIVDRSTNTLRSYVNGIKYGSEPSIAGYGNVDYTNTLFIGSERTDLSFFDGTIDDARVYNRALSATDVKALYTSTGGGSGDIKTGLKGYWKFDEGSGTVANDSTGNGNTGTLTNGPTWAAGKINNALTFNGSTQYVDAGLRSSLNLSTTGTVSAWVKFSTVPSSWPGVVCNEDIDSDKNGYCLYVDSSGKFDLELSDASSYANIQSPGTYNDNNWHLIAGTWDGSNLYLYADGAMVAGPVSQTHTPVSTVFNLEIGTTGNKTNYFNGLIDDARVYNRALSASDVLTLYNTTAPACAGPVGYTGDLMYNGGTYHVPQFCNGTNWIPVGPVSPAGGGGGGCTSPSGNEGDMMYNGVSRLTQYCDGATWRAMGGNIPITGLVGWWNFDEGSGMVANDSTGNGNTGTLVNSPTWTTSGKINDALTFNGTTSYVDSSNFADNLSNFTVAAWFKTSTTPTGQFGAIASKLGSGGWGSGTGWGLGIEGASTGAPSTLTTIIQTNGSNWRSTHTTASLTDGNWHHAVMVVTGGNTVTLYLDGTIPGTALNNAGTMSGYSNNSNVRIGTDYNSEFFTGTIDDVRVYNRALSASEVWRLYNGAP